MNKYRKSLLGTFIVLILALISYSYADNSSQKQSSKDIKEDNTPILVEVSEVKTTNIPQEINSLGSLTASQIVTISSEVDGRISKIFFKSGDQVGKGMPIIQLDNSKAQADYDAAVTALNLSRSKFNRGKLLLNQAISQQDFEQLKADVESKEADLKTAQATLNQKQIKAPFAGILDSFKVQEGDFTVAGDPLVILVNSEELEAEYNVPERYLPQLKQSQLVKLTVSAYPNQIFYGNVNFISPTVSDVTRTVELHALIDNREALLSPGMFAQITQEIGLMQNVMIVPEVAVSADVKGYYLFKVVNNQVLKTYVKIGERVKGVVEIEEGLQPRDKIVTAGQQKLQDGSYVAIQTQAT